MNDPTMDTPDWIREWMDRNHGGWALPFPVGRRHPLTADTWRCFECEGFFVHGHYAVVMPLMDDSPRWIVYHRVCLLSLIMPRQGEE